MKQHINAVRNNNNRLLNQKRKGRIDFGNCVRTDFTIYKQNKHQTNKIPQFQFVIIQNIITAHNKSNTEN